MKNGLYAVGLALLASSQVVQTQGATEQYSQKVLLKNWAVSRCLAEVYADPKTKDDANATAGAYLEAGRQPIGAYEALGVIVSKYASLKYGSVAGSELNTMKCIDLLNSRELDELAGKLLKRK